MDGARRRFFALTLGAGLLSGASCFLDLGDLTGGPPSPDAGADGGVGASPGVCVKGDCGGGPCVVASGADALGAWGVALGGGYLFWTNQQGNSIKRLDLATGKLRDYVPTSQSPAAIAVNKTHVVWVDMAGVWQCPIDGVDCASGATPLAQPGGSGAFQIRDLAVDDTYAYWTYDAVSDTDGKILRCAIVSGCASSPEELAITQTHPRGIAVDGAASGFVYWAHYGSAPQFGEVRRIHKDLSDSQVPARIAVNRDFAASVAIGGADVYWTEDTRDMLPGGVYRCPADQTSCAAGMVADPMGQAASEKIAAPIGLAIDGARVYWANNLGSTVMSCALPACVGHPAVVAQGQTNPRAVAVGTSCVYWADATDGGRVLRIAK